MQKARRHPKKRGSDRSQAHGFRVSFTPLPAVLFTFPSRYSSTIGLPGVLSLGGWCRRIRTGLLRPRPTQGTARAGERSAYGAVTLCGAPFQAASATLAPSLSGSPTTPPAPRRRRFGLAPFRSPLLGGSLLFSSPPATWMFRFAGFAPAKRRAPRPRAAGCPIRKPADQRQLAPPRGLSQPAASFIASGSHRHPPCALSRLPARTRPRNRRRPRRETPKAARLRRARRGDTAPRPPRDNARKPRSTNSLSQLSLPPPTRRAPARHDGVLPMPSMNPAPQRRGKVEDVGVEPTASGLQSRRSSQLSQSPGPVVPGGLEPPASTLSVWRSNRAELQDWTRPSGPRSKAGAACRGPAGSPRRGEGEARAKAAPPERRCSSRTFRYGYLVTT